ncbi:MAG: hypothetical protein CMK74_00800 [Pseudomonadales bacterium]|jgi:hypothetical protein|nr:hypothetical protein [Pseudomonadales bacterium]
MSHSARRVGLTPAFLRIAYYYLCLGVGEYTPKHAHYDRVVVHPLYEFNENPQHPGVLEEFAGGLVVEFFLKQKRVRSIDFRCQIAGWSGVPVMRSI